MNKFFVFTVLLIASKSFSQGFTNRCGTIADMNLIQTDTKIIERIWPVVCKKLQGIPI